MIMLKIIQIKDYKNYLINARNEIIYLFFFNKMSSLINVRVKFLRK